MTDAQPSASQFAADPRVATILDIVAQQTAVERARLTPAARVDELGIASIDMVQTIFELESRFDIEIPVVQQEAGTEFTTIGDLLGHVLATLDRKALADETPKGAAA